MTEANSFKILGMPQWKSKILDTVAWILGYRGEHVYCILLNLRQDELTNWAQDNKDFVEEENG